MSRQKSQETNRTTVVNVFPNCEGATSLLQALAVVLVLGLVLSVRACQMTDGMTAEQAACLWRGDRPCSAVEGGDQP